MYLSPKDKQWEKPNSPKEEIIHLVVVPPTPPKLKAYSTMLKIKRSYTAFASFCLSLETRFYTTPHKLK
jgi:hypothetical protein